MTNRPRFPALVALLTPGLLVAATGVGAGDLLTASLAGSKAGLAMAWAVVLGALLKWSLNEGLARWQMATGTTLLEGWARRLGGWIRWVFLAYFLIWSVMTGAALIKACGVAGDGLLPIGGDSDEGRARSQAIWGAAHSLAGLALVRLGGFRLFERVMAALIAGMFAGVITSAILLRPDPAVILQGLTRPRIGEGNLTYALGLLGGVGGTVTLLSYGYWVRESGRSGEPGARRCRVDLAVAYAATAAFGVAMLVISSRVQVSSKGNEIALVLADEIAGATLPIGRWLFLAGFWGAVFSSLLGVWQSAPYLFADFLRLNRRDAGDEVGAADLARSRGYRAFLWGIALVPLPLLAISVRRVQLGYAVMGSLFMPLLAVTLLLLNNRERWVGPRLRNGPASNALLVLTLITFVAVGIADLIGRLK